MKRQEKIRLIKGMLSGAISPKEIKSKEVEIWVQVDGGSGYKNMNTGKYVTSDILDKIGQGENILRLVFVDGKKIL